MYPARSGNGLLAQACSRGPCTTVRVAKLTEASLRTPPQLGASPGLLTIGLTASAAPPRPRLRRGRTYADQAWPTAVHERQFMIMSAPLVTAGGVAAMCSGVLGRANGASRPLPSLACLDHDGVVRASLPARVRVRVCVCARQPGVELGRVQPAATRHDLALEHPHDLGGRHPTRGRCLGVATGHGCVPRPTNRFTDRAGYMAFVLPLLHGDEGWHGAMGDWQACLPRCSEEKPGVAHGLAREASWQCTINW